MITSTYNVKGQSTLPESCLVCEHSPLSADDCKPNKALRLTVKAFLKSEEKKRDKSRKESSSSKNVKQEQSGPNVDQGESEAPRRVDAPTSSGPSDKDVSNVTNEVNALKSSTDIAAAGQRNDKVSKPDINKCRSNNSLNTLSE